MVAYVKACDVPHIAIADLPHTHTATANPEHCAGTLTYPAIGEWRIGLGPVYVAFLDAGDGTAVVSEPVTSFTFVGAIGGFSGHTADPNLNLIRFGPIALVATSGGASASCEGSIPCQAGGEAEFDAAGLYIHVEAEWPEIIDLCETLGEISNSGP